MNKREVKAFFVVTVITFVVAKSLYDLLLGCEPEAGTKRLEKKNQGRSQ